MDRAEKVIAHRLQSPATALVLLRFWCGWCRIRYRARTMPPDSLILCAMKMRTSLMKCLGCIIQVPPPTSHGFVRRCPSREGGSASGTWCSTPSSSLVGFQQQHQSSAAAVWVQQHHTTTQRGTGTTHSQSFLSNLCDAHTLDTLMELATQGTGCLQLYQVPGARGWFESERYCACCSILVCQRSGGSRLLLQSVLVLRFPVRGLVDCFYLLLVAGG